MKTQNHGLCPSMLFCLSYSFVTVWARVRECEVRINWIVSGMHWFLYNWFTRRGVRRGGVAGFYYCNACLELLICWYFWVKKQKKELVLSGQEGGNLGLVEKEKGMGLLRNLKVDWVWKTVGIGSWHF